MITLDVHQGSIEWIQARLGIPTCSSFDRIITAAKGNKSSQFDAYAHELIAEELLGYPAAQESTGFMARGTALEAKAVEFYELQRDCETEVVGLALRDDRRVGGSPDRLVGKDGGLEIKCPTPSNHIAYLLDTDGIGYRCQVQGLLWITERQWWDTLSYHPSMPPALVRVNRDDIFIAKLSELVNQFVEYKDELKSKLQKTHGLFPGQQIGRPLLAIA